FKMDNEYGAYLAVHHLIELGHREIAFISGPANNIDANERLAGYQRALQEAGEELEDRLEGVVTPGKTPAITTGRAA
ncbi:MAG: substrate-binding domain-containing protein, partial [Hyphomicrobiales bacterium]|nr:substrate-binding domain-containing protein [Hyphomicrobiales bacterium]